MLPFLNLKKAATVVKGDQTSETVDSSYGMEAAANKLIQGVKEGDAKRVVEAFSEMSEMCESIEEVEGE